MQEENGRKSSTREFLSYVPTACFEAATIKVADIKKRVQKAFHKDPYTIGKP